MKESSWDVEQHSVCRIQVVFATQSLVTLPSPTAPDGPTGFYHACVQVTVILFNNGLKKQES